MVDRPGAPAMPAIEGEVQFEDVWSAYVPGQYVLRGVSFRRAGETVAIVGPTGAGKTTIINLIPRFYDAARGAAGRSTARTSAR